MIKKEKDNFKEGFKRELTNEKNSESWQKRIRGGGRGHGRWDEPQEDKRPILLDVRMRF